MGEEKMENQKDGVNITAEKFINDLFQENLQIEDLDEVLESAAFANAAGDSILLAFGNYNSGENFPNTMVIDGGTFFTQAVWVNIRYDQSPHCISHAKKLAIAIAKILPQYPTALVDTGTSIQAYWFFSDDLDVLDENSYTKVLDAVRACQGSICSMAELVGLQVTEPYYDQLNEWIWDYLMLPGFINHYTVDKKRVELIHFDLDKRYAVSEFEYLMNPIQKHSQMANGLLKKYGNLFERLILNEIGEEVVVSGYCNTKKEKVED